MIRLKTENNCVGCPQGCINCGRGKHEALDALVCDYCGNEVDALYKYDGDQVCASCLCGDFEKIDEGNWEYNL